MPNPVLLQTYPANLDAGIPTGQSITLIFDRGVDLTTVKNNVVLYGRDFDRTSGPDSAYWVDPKTSHNPFFLKSPGFTGVVELEFTAVYVDLSDYTEIVGEVFLSRADELAYGTDGAGHKVIASPKNFLAPEVEYTLHINGDPDSVSRGISARTAAAALSWTNCI
jgi:hypothetical protein